MSKAISLATAHLNAALVALSAHNGGAITNESGPAKDVPVTTEQYIAWLKKERNRFARENHDLRAQIEELTAKLSKCPREVVEHHTADRTTGAWVPWRGARGTLDRCAIVSVRLRNGIEKRGRAGAFQWAHMGHGFDIVSYRVESTTSEQRESEQAGCRKEDTQAPALPDGWKVNGGFVDFMPVAGHKRVDVRYRCGEEEHDLKASLLRWIHVCNMTAGTSNAAYDIVGWRLHEEPL